ncbi:MAG: aldehyde dehydrogenase family protein [Polyangiales bacterium]
MTVQTIFDDLRKRPGTGELIPVIDPTTEEVITEFRDCGEQAVQEAVGRARESFEEGVWAKQAARDRAKVLWKIADLMDERAEEFAQLDSIDAGIPIDQARIIVPSSAEFFRYFAGWCTKLNGEAYDVQMSGGISGAYASFHAYTYKEPQGVVGLIFPWNGPIFNACAKLAPALAAGNSCLLKPAEETPLSAVLLDQVVREAGVPDGVVNLLTGFGHTAGAAITAHDGVDKVAFTGSTEVGKMIVKAATGNLKKVMLELGGKSPVIIYDDADLEQAIPMASMGIFVHSGQGCVCGSRIFVHRKVYAQVVEGIANVANEFLLGGRETEGAHSGPLISQKQLNRVLGFIDDAKKEGVEIVAGGHRLDRRGYYVHPTVLANTKQTSRLYREEIFGPVVSILPFDDDDEVVRMANDTTYGLWATVWTQNLARAHTIAKRLQAGSVSINAQLLFDHNVPFGGYKQSGWGHEFGREGIEGYLKTKTIWAQL